MRYRPFSHTGMAISALSLALHGEGDERSANDWRDLIHAAFEEGVNAFEFIHPSPALLKGFAMGAASVQRRLLFIALRIDEADDAAHLADAVGEVISEAGLGDLDLISVNADPSRQSGIPAAMRLLKDQGRVRSLGVAGESDLLTDHVRNGAFDALITSFNILSGWRERHLIRTAVEQQMAVIGCDPHPPEVDPLAEAAHAQARPGWFAKRNPLASAGSYAFLSATPGWSAEQLCLGYALTEPSLATVQVSVFDPPHLTSLAEITERDLPAAASAQIEMARFSAERASGAERRSERRSA
ncbi:MAG: hypothetical protein ACHP7N_06385 [Caulobacterales bacterium]